MKGVKALQEHIDVLINKLMHILHKNVTRYNSLA
jgi:hypothetical protein